MARQVRIEFLWAIYHVMVIRTLGEGCERAGFRVHASVLMSNHYHLLLETPEANLARGMGWLQNALRDMRAHETLSKGMEGSF